MHYLWLVNGNDLSVLSSTCMTGRGRSRPPDTVPVPLEGIPASVLDFAVSRRSRHVDMVVIGLISNGSYRATDSLLHFTRIQDSHASRTRTHRMTKIFRHELTYNDRHHRYLRQFTGTPGGLIGPVG